MSSRRSTRAAALALCVLTGAGANAGAQNRPGQERPGQERPGQERPGRDWISHNSVDEDAYSALDRINRSNVKSLGLEWSLDLPGEQSLEATPLAVDGVLYFTGSHAAVYAVDAASGKLKWKYDPQTWKQNPAKLMFMFGINRGAAYADGRVFSGTLDGRLIALDGKTGSLLWSTQTVPEAGGRDHHGGSPHIQRQGHHRQCRRGRRRARLRHGLRRRHRPAGVAVLHHTRIAGGKPG